MNFAVFHFHLKQVRKAVSVLKTMGETTFISTLLICFGIAFAFHILFLVSYFILFKNDEVADAVVGMVHALIIVSISVYSYIFADQQHDPLDYYTIPYPLSNIAFRISLGFFLWHSLQYVFPRSGQYKWDMLIHSGLCIWTYGIVVLTDWMHRPAMIGLFYDFSTLWLQTMRIMNQYQMHSLREHFKFSIRSLSAVFLWQSCALRYLCCEHFAGRYLQCHSFAVEWWSGHTLSGNFGAFSSLIRLRLWIDTEFRSIWSDLQSLLAQRFKDSICIGRGASFGRESKQ